MNSETRRLIFERLRDSNPHPTTELEYTSPFELLIAVIVLIDQHSTGFDDILRLAVKQTDGLYVVFQVINTKGVNGFWGVCHWIELAGCFVDTNICGPSVCLTARRRISSKPVEC
jgi:endonuclease-3